MNNGPTTPQGYPPPPPHAGYGPPPRKNYLYPKWVRIVVMLVIVLPAALVLLGAVGFFMLARDAREEHAKVDQIRIEQEAAKSDYAGAQEVLQAEQWTCIRVIDGDTIEVVLGDKTERVRLLCIDTPERGEPGYDEATQALKQLVDGYRVDVVRDPEHDERDNFGRLLGYVIFSDHNNDGPLERIGLNVNVEMVKLGHSGYYTKYGVSSMYDAKFREAAQDE